MERLRRGREGHQHPCPEGPATVWAPSRPQPACGLSHPSPCRGLPLPGPPDPPSGPFRACGMRTLQQCCQGERAGCPPSSLTALPSAHGPGLWTPLRCHTGLGACRLAPPQPGPGRVGATQCLKQVMRITGWTLKALGWSARRLLGGLSDLPAPTPDLTTEKLAAWWAAWMPRVAD